jgi:hypothetical protein
MGISLSHLSSVKFHSVVLHPRVCLLKIYRVTVAYFYSRLLPYYKVLLKLNQIFDVMREKLKNLVTQRRRLFEVKLDVSLIKRIFCFEGCLELL